MRKIKPPIGNSIWLIAKQTLLNMFFIQEHIAKPVCFARKCKIHYWVFGQTNQSKFPNQPNLATSAKYDPVF